MLWTGDKSGAKGGVLLTELLKDRDHDFLRRDCRIERATNVAAMPARSSVHFSYRDDGYR